MLTERLNSITEKDKELERIFDYVSDLNKINMLYIPVDHDKIDKQLADIINSAGRNNDLNKAKMLLVREGDGHYTYCKKKVYVMKNEKDNLIVRVGGGYMSFEQFIHTYNPFQFFKQKQYRADTDSKTPYKTGTSVSKKAHLRSSPRGGVNSSLSTHSK